MHVGLNLLFLVPGETGGRETYARELTRALVLERPDLRLTAFIGREASAIKDSTWLSDLRTVTVPINTRSRAAWAFGEQALLPRLAARERVEILHSTANTAPAFGSFRRVVTIHDVLHLKYPDLLGTVSRLGTRAIVGGAARTAHRVITGCEASRDEIVSLMGLHPDRIDVVPHGFGTAPSNRPTPIAELRAKFELGNRAFILASAIRVPHKNIPRLLDALALIQPDRRPMLTLTGPRGSHDDEIGECIRRNHLEGDVHLLGWVDQADLDGLFAGASCFVLPTLYEGFGLPILEAMARGVPVACSNIGPLREVSGDVALLFDPFDPRSIADAIEELTDPEVDQTQRVDRGRARAAGFTWQRSAQGTLASYERALRSPLRPARASR